MREQHYNDNPLAVFAAAAAKDRTFMAQGACGGLDPNDFFPDRGGSVAKAVAVCATCLVRQECLDYALSYPCERFGVWGGRSERERRAIKRQRRRLATPPVPQRGTRACYMTQCGHPECREANTRYTANRRVRGYKSPSTQA